MVYGQHPAWMVVTLMGAGVEAVSLYARGHADHARVTFADRMPADICYGHHYEMFRMAATFREMIKTRREPIPHQEILDVTALIPCRGQIARRAKPLVKLAVVM